MRLATFILAFLLCVPTLASAVSFVEQESSFDIASWRDITTEETYYGELSGFPHTFQFLVSEPTTFSATLGVRKGQDPVSLILVKEVSRGVEEIVRVSAQKDTSEIYKDNVLGLRLARYAPVTYELTDGMYRLEVSAPDNMAKYQLIVGTEKVATGYIATLSEIVAVHSFFGVWFGAVRSPYVYWPLLLLVCSWYVVRYTRRNIWQK